MSCARSLRPEQGRVPPHDLDAEAAVLSAIFLEPRCFDEVCGVLDVEHFYSDANRRIYDTVRALQQTGRPIDVVTVAGDLRDHERLQQVGGTPYLAQLADATPAIAHVEAHARTIREKWRLRQFIATCQRYAAEGYGDCGEPQAFIDEAEAAVFAIAHETDVADSLTPFRSAIHEAMLQAQAAQQSKGGVTGLPSGLFRLDEKLTGFHRGDLYILAGRPGMGKSALASQCARAAASAKPPWSVVEFNLEMPRHQLGARDVATHAMVDLSRLRAGKVRDEEWNRLVESEVQLARLPRYLDVTPAITLLHLRAKVRRLQATIAREGGPVLGLVVVDYLQLMRGSGSAKTRDQEIGEISRGLKALAKEMDVAVIALSQLNRSVETRSDKRPQLSDLRESGAIEQDADAIVFVYRDEYYHKETAEKGIAELIIAKQRNGPTGTLRVRFQSAFTRFDSLDESKYEFGDASGAPDPWGDFDSNEG